MFSTQCDDIYFSREDGLAESCHTYLAGNNLPQAWIGKNDFHILELGFGSGLNFLATLKLWEQAAKPDQKLYYTAVEKFPLGWDEISAGLSHWQGEIGAQLEALAAVYPQTPNGRHILQLDENITLDLLCMDIDEALLLIEPKVNAFYLDGFAPAKNEAMWSQSVFEHLSRLSVPGSRFATFTVAAIVRRNAQGAGFIIEKKRGFGLKREMLVGVYKG